MEASVTWNGAMSFTGTADSGFKVELDADPSVGGDANGFRPLELMAMSLVGCTAMDVISILRKMREDVTDFQVKAHFDRAANHPKVFTAIQIEYIVQGHNIKDDSVMRAIELSEQIYCPAQAMLRQVASITITHKIIEQD